MSIQPVVTEKAETPFHGSQGSNTSAQPWQQHQDSLGSNTKINANAAHQGGKQPKKAAIEDLIAVFSRCMNPK